jgi:hypothetical protein
MYHQSTAPRSRSARLQDAAVVALIILGLGAWAGTAAYDVASAPPVAPAPAATVAADARVPQTVGTVGTLGYNTVAWVDDLGLSAWSRALDNRDDKGMESALRAFESFEIPGDARVRITNRRGSAMQVEVLDGPLRGRRGWTERVLWWQAPA